MKPAAKNHIDNGGIDSSVLQPLGKKGRVTDNEEANVIAVHVKPEPLQA